MTTAYSYLRFSSDKQEQGDSVRRQLKLAEDYAVKHSLKLDTSTYRDLGVSAFKGKNKVEGSLGAFLEAIQKKRIKAGSVLLVESLDRLSRESVDTALELFMSIIRRGITIVTLQDGQIYSTESIKDNWTKLIIALAVMARAHEESLTKSMRVKEAWNKKREAGEVLTRMCPAWLKYDKDWKVNEKKADTVRRIFKMAMDGHGTPAIARLLNEDKTPTMGWAKEWTFGTVAAILKNPAVIGTLVSKKTDADPVEDYYPSIVSKQLYYEVQARVTSRKWIGGRSTENVRNLFSGYCFCSLCGSKMRAVGSSEQHTYMRCLSAYSNSGCDAGRMPYLAVEKTVLAQFAFQNRDLIPEVEEVEKSKLAVLQAEVDEHKKKMDNLIRLAEATGDIDQVVIRIAELKGEIRKREEAVEALKKPALTVAEGFKTHQWYEQLDSLEGEARVELRRKIQASIRRFLKRLEMNPERMLITLHFASGKVREFDVTPYKEQVGGNRIPTRRNM